MAKRLRVGVVFGGRSAEHEVSVASARNVLEAMDRDRYEPVLIGIDREGRWLLDDESRLLLDAAGTLPALSLQDAAAAREVALVPRGRSNELVDLEIECSVLGNDAPRASAPGEVLPTHEFYDYEAKYLDEHGAALEIPARLSPAKADEVRGLAVRAFRVLCANGMARVDLFLRPDGTLLVNEINTIPGFTRISTYPKLWEASGVSCPEPVDRLIQLALERHAAERGLETSV